MKLEKNKDRIKTLKMAARNFVKREEFLAAAVFFVGFTVFLLELIF
ncbi:hypothetical protein [Fulvivirga aurantia]|nr:hypothetical protein [Fulvivirga aurantia]